MTTGGSAASVAAATRGSKPTVNLRAELAPFGRTNNTSVAVANSNVTNGSGLHL